VASPEMRDPNFSRAVVLMLEHNEEGALGLTLNRPGELDVIEVLPQWGDLLCIPMTVFAGGPVEREMAVGLARRPGVEHREGWHPVLEGVGVIDLSLEPPEVEGVEDLRVFSGYAGWGASQLELELVIGSWFVIDGDTADAFDSHPDTLWQRVLARQGGHAAIYALYPEDVRLN